MIYDVVVIGAGAAGMTTALYTARANLKTLIIERGLHGGQMQNTADIENYAGFQEISGAELSDYMYEQVVAHGAEFTYGNVKSISKVDGIFNIVKGKKVIQSKAVVIATGVKHKQLGVEGEERLAGRGVCYCAVCDGAFFQDKDIIVVGGGDSALEESNYLTQFANSVTILNRSEAFTGQAILQDRVYNNPKIKTVMNTHVIEICGDNKVEKVITNNGEIACDGVFVYIGLDPITEPFQDLGILSAMGYIFTDNNMETIISGLFAVGDVRAKKVRQIATAVGDGAVAGVEVNRYLESLAE